MRALYRDRKTDVDPMEDLTIYLLEDGRVSFSFGITLRDARSALGNLGASIEVDAEEFLARRAEALCDVPLLWWTARMSQASRDEVIAAIEADVRGRSASASSLPAKGGRPPRS